MMQTQQFEMVAKTFQGLEEVLAEELRSLGALNVEPGLRMVSFEGDKAMLYRANMCCRTALRILKPIYKFIARNPDELYELIKAYDWSRVLSLDKTFSIDTVANSEEFNHSRYATYRVKDGIVDYFRDKIGPESRPRVRLQDADVRINVHIQGERVTVSLDSSGESLHKRGYRVAQTEAPINEVLAAGIILKSGWRGDCPFVDPMCGSGTFVIEAAMIAAGIWPGVYRRRFAFETWADFDPELFDAIYNDESNERTVTQPIIGCDMSPRAIAIAQENVKSAGVGKWVHLEVKPLSQWTEAPADGILVTNPPYGERISSPDMEGLYALIGTKLKQVFTGYHAWIIGYREEYFQKIGLAPSTKEPIYNGALECELREYVIFEGDYRSFRREGGHLKTEREKRREKEPRRYKGDREWREDARKAGFGGKKLDRKRAGDSRSGEFKRGNDFHRSEKSHGTLSRGEERYRPQKGRFAHRFNDEPDRAPASENPLAVRRNEMALKSITGRQPSLSEDKNAPIFRPRRGWKRPGSNNETENNNQ
ncbi:MAG: THUMP domain-containing protein [Firmicutes bacterium]|nr:THUMP domain-containing protein [Bacillota bacterium]MCM1401442.1 THUMP domain-containing protein [Bacteroides sp.]MCM1476800.1 THUMP domain-containing protein [Bacteroides sp.]